MNLPQGTVQDDWLRTRQRLRDAAMTSLYTNSLWPGVSVLLLPVYAGCNSSVAEHPTSRVGRARLQRL